MLPGVVENGLFIGMADAAVIAGADGVVVLEPDDDGRRTSHERARQDACMTGFDFDLFVIGGGSGGVRAARIAAGHGASVALAEEYR